MDAAETPGFDGAAMDTLARLRAEGWRVAVHNDYRLDGQDCTFWLLTHQDGRYTKGEGTTDAVALRLASDNRPPPRDAVP